MSDSFKPVNQNLIALLEEMRRVPVLSPTKLILPNTKEELMTLIDSTEGIDTQNKILEHSQRVLELVQKISQMIELGIIPYMSDHMTILKVHSEIVNVQLHYIGQIRLLRLAHDLLK